MCFTILHFAAVLLDLLLHDPEIIAPEIGGFDVVVGVGVEAFVRRNEFVELMKDEKNRVKLGRVVHKRIERRVGAVVTVTKSVIGTVWAGVRSGNCTSPSVLSGGRDGCGEVFDPLVARHASQIADDVI